MLEKQVKDAVKAKVEGSIDSLVDKLEENLRYDPNYSAASGRMSLSHVDLWDIDITVKIRKREGR